jgi:mono/diheme cytochrome c family protein
MTRFQSLLSLFLACCAFTLERANASDEDLFFVEKVLPIFREKCFACHGPDQQKSGYRLDVRQIAVQGAELGEAAILPGNSDESPLFQYVSNQQADLTMPPKASGRDRLTAVEIERVKQWIDRGAHWPDSATTKLSAVSDWWSFRPLRLPEVPANDKNPIDAFVNQKLMTMGLKMSPPADPRTLVRRLYFDLVGLPPGPEESDQFIAAYEIDADAAYDRLVDTLLASPRYGERWARHWLDIVHYGDTHGYDKDKQRPNAWPYRDYVVRSFNEDKPYRRFIEEQIAGDVMYPNTRDGIEALGFVAAGPWDFIGHAEVPETKIDGKIARHLDRDDMVANTIGTFCSVTVHCAQCHNHKFDPINQDDYYSLHAVFAALDRTDRKYYRDEETLKSFQELENAKDEAAARLERLEKPLREAAGQAYVDIKKQIEDASKANAKQPNGGPEYGYHSQIESQQEVTKWVQVDLGVRTNILRIQIQPCFDEFNNIGAGFGFPIRFKIEASDDPSFKTGVNLLWRRHDETFMNDFENPKLKAFISNGAKDDGTSGRYVRITATKLAPRQNDFIFAISELEVYDLDNNNVARGKPVTALDSIEAAPRWRMLNLTDGLYPKPMIVESKEELVEQRDNLLLKQLPDDDAKANYQSAKKELIRIQSEITKLPPPELVYAGGIHHGTGPFRGTGPDGGKPRSIFVLARGQVTTPGKEVTPGTLSALDFSPSRFNLDPDASEGERRIALAKWITDFNNPLTYRSIVNRVWQYHFGRAIVDTANDFGRNGGLPSHPEMLDWLAIHFRDSGGSLKSLHRTIVKSRTYRQSSTNNPAAARIDSDNVLLWRQNRRRLEAEAVHDSVLVVSGKMDFTMGGPGWQDFVVEHPEHSPHYEYALADPEDKKTWRRSVYRFVVRSQTHPWMTSLDCADPSMRVDKRNESLSAIQALALLNNGFMLTQSKHFADRVASEQSELEQQVARACQLALGSIPDQMPVAELNEFASKHGLANLCRVLFNLNAFSFVD